MLYTIHTMTAQGEVSIRLLSAGDLNPFTEEFHEAVRERVSIALGKKWSVARVLNTTGQVVARVERD